MSGNGFIASRLHLLYDKTQNTFEFRHESSAISLSLIVGVDSKVKNADALKFSYFIEAYATDYLFGLLIL